MNLKREIIFVLTFFIGSLVIGQNNKKVLIIGIDGCRPDALQVANTPNLNSLINNGIYSPDALNDDITISGPGWSANLCGVWSNKHQVTDNTFLGDNYANYPSIFRLIEEYNNNFHTVSICHWDPINDYIVQNYVDHKLNVNSDQDVSNEAANYIALNDLDLMFLHFDDVDHAGHSYGFSPNVTEYITAIEGVDGYLSSIIQAILQRPNYANEDWLILVTTDHGGLGYSHGGNSPEEENVFVIASGNSFPTQVIYKDSSVIVDSAFNCLGDSVNLQFDGNNDHIQVPSNSVYDFGTAQDFTVECRVRTSMSGDVAIVGNKDWFSGSNKGFVFSFKYPSGPEWKVNIGDGFNRADINTGGSIADDQWHTLSVSFDRDGYMKMYEDGVLLDSADISSVGDITTGQGLFFGADINGSYGFSGSIAEVRVWNNLLDNSSIQDWYCSRPDNTHPYFNDLIGYWKLNEGGGVNAIDHSSLAYNGNINGAVWNFVDSTIIYDYSLTPRITDVAVTSLTHLCIPIDSNWDLDGSSLIPACNSTSIQENTTIATLFPNPTNDLINLDINGYNGSIQTEVFDLSGRLLKSTNNTTISLENYARGIYVFRVAYGDRVEELKVVKD